MVSALSLRLEKYGFDLSLNLHKAQRDSELKKPYPVL